MDRRRDRRPGADPPLSPGARRAQSRLLLRLRRWLRPPRTLRPTRAGWLFFALTLGVGFAAMNTGNNLLYMVLSLLLAFLVLSGVLSESALRGLEVRRRLPREIFAEAPAPVALEVRNSQKRVPSFAIVVEDLVGPDLERASVAGRVFAFRVGAGARESRSYGLRAGARGPLRFAGFRVSTRYPFGLFSKSMRIEAGAETLVYPAVDPAPLRADGGDGDAGEADTASGDGAGVSGLRDWISGDPHRRVHWRASLRRARLLVRERERETRSEHVVRLRTRGAAGGERFEREVRRAASEAVAHWAAGWRVGLRTDASHLAPGDGLRHRRRLLTRLATIAPEDDACPARPGAAA